MNIHSRVWPSRGDWVGCKMDPEASKRHRRAMSAVVRRPSSSLRPGTARSGASAKPRARPYSAYSERGADQDQTPKFDHPATNREWWRYYLKDTPTPGTYRLGSFLDELSKKTSGTCSFRNPGRKKPPAMQQATGGLLLPGAYDSSNFLLESARKIETFGFKAVERESGPKIGHGYGDKELDTTPNQYNVVDYNAHDKNKGKKTAVFRDKEPRVLSANHQFRVIQGPGPGRYDAPRKTAASMTSIFQSKVPRFKPSSTGTPGPGAYNVAGSRPYSSASLMHLSKKHGLVFESKT